MKHVLKHRETGKFVARSGMAHSYTKKAEDAQTFDTREEAERNSCPESEVPVPSPRM